MQAPTFRGMIIVIHFWLTLCTNNYSFWKNALLNIAVIQTAYIAAARFSFVVSGSLFRFIMPAASAAISVTAPVNIMGIIVPNWATSPKFSQQLYMRAKTRFKVKD